MTKAPFSEESLAIKALRHAIEVLSQSSNAHELCRRLAHSEFMDGFCHGVAAYLLDQRSNLIEVATYGRTHSFESQTISAWDDNVLSQSIRKRQIIVEKNDDSTLFALPIELAGVITGAFLFTLAGDVENPIFSRETTEMLSSLGGLFMDNKGLSLNPASPITSNTVGTEELTAQELTTRQVKILEFMADGLTNAEISKLVLLSESTVRQETIRIFRTLKCHSRLEAIVKARALGLVSRISQSENASID